MDLENSNIQNGTNSSQSAGSAGQVSDNQPDYDYDPNADYLDILESENMPEDQRPGPSGDDIDSILKDGEAEQEGNAPAQNADQSNNVEASKTIDQRLADTQEQNRQLSEHVKALTAQVNQ